MIPLWALGCDGSFGCTCPQLRAMHTESPRKVVLPKAQHGLRSTYLTMKCRCPACVRANSIYMAKYREGRRNRDAAA